MKKDPYAPLRDQMNEPPTHWRSIDQVEGNEELKTDVDAEFPRGVTPTNGWNRRDALKLAGASLSMGLAACDINGPAGTKIELRRRLEEDLPYARMPENVIPGVRLQYATAMQRSE